jgi:protein-S-isoprenylcysteine O-methyltransferase Ste14
MALPVLLNLAALALFVLGSKAHGASDFLGIQSAVAAFKGKPRAPNRALSTGGILSWVRHPWYAGTLLLLWGHDLDAAGLVASAVLTAYIIVGTLLEEQKLAASFGRAYREYQRRVPMFIPRRPSK